MISETIGKKDLLARLHQLPSLPAIVQELIASFNDADLDTVLLANKIEHDQGLSARVLRVANSSFYGLSRKVGSVQDALVVLGFECVRSMALSAGMVHAFPSSPDSSFDRQAYWQRSFRVAAIAKALSRELRQGKELAFTAGMFHDIGLLVLDLCIPQQFSKLLQQQADSGLSLIELERSELGFDHVEIGAELIRLWNFPSEIEQVVRYWRQPELQADPLAGIVHISVLAESGLSGEALLMQLPKNLHEQMFVIWERIESSLPTPEQLEAAAGWAQAS
ncbi:MAG: HDOD domain-containing protein [Proteobacteria bacterium]|nr:HDOD domain-containing protein [Pseudomonadota bacterium]